MLLVILATLLLLTGAGVFVAWPLLALDDADRSSPAGDGGAEQRSRGREP